jgi:hypothetical protein
MMRRLSEHNNIFNMAEKLAEPGPRDRIAAWIYGVVVAVIPTAYGFWCVAAKSAIFVGGRPICFVTYSGAAAIALGITYVSVGLFLHCHFFWSTHERYAGFGDIAKMVSIAGVIGGIGYFIYSVALRQ